MCAGIPFPGEDREVVTELHLPVFPGLATVVTTCCDGPGLVSTLDQRLDPEQRSN